MLPSHHRRRRLTWLPRPLRSLLSYLLVQKGWQAFLGVLALLCIINYKVTTMTCLTCKGKAPDIERWITTSLWSAWSFLATMIEFMIDIHTTDAVQTFAIHCPGNPQNKWMLTSAENSLHLSKRKRGKLWDLNTLQVEGLRADQVSLDAFMLLPVFLWSRREVWGAGLPSCRAAQGRPC